MGLGVRRLPTCGRREAAGGEQRVLRESRDQPRLFDQRFLLYIPSAKPAEPDNWLLDLLLAGHEFTADRASLDIAERINAQAGKVGTPRWMSCWGEQQVVLELSNADFDDF